MGQIEQIAAGTFDSYHSKIAGHRITPFRRVLDYEIEFFENDYYYTTINEKRVDFRKNRVILAKPGDVRRSKLHFSCQFIHVRFAEGELKSFFSSLPNCIAVSEPELFRDLFHEISLASVSENRTLELTSLFYRLAAMLETSMVNSIDLGIPQKNNDLLYIASSYIERNYMYGITLADIAGEVNLHPNYFHRIFKNAYGITPLQYLLQVRLAQAKYLLMNTEKRITEIASLCGFDSQSYFSYAFHRQFEISPLAFRQSYKKLI